MDSVLEGDEIALDLSEVCEEDLVLKRNSGGLSSIILGYKALIDIQYKTI